MAKASAYIELPIQPNEVWQLIGGFDSLPDWLPYIPYSELHEGGRVRHLNSSEGGTIIERLINFDEKERSYTYHILQAPFPVTEYYSTVKVTSTSDGRGSRVDWFGEFKPVNVSDKEAEALFKGIYEAGLKALKDHYIMNN
ncbi:SRPBCC family protein [Chryseobacterium wanjuense]